MWGSGGGKRGLRRICAPKKTDAEKQKAAWVKAAFIVFSS
jgi:hypothetical protein